MINLLLLFFSFLIVGSTRGNGLTNSPEPIKVCGPLTTFSFVIPSKCHDDNNQEQTNIKKAAIDEKTNHLKRDGLMLVAKEKGGKLFIKLIFNNV